MDQQDKEQLRYFALHGAQALFFAGLLMLVLMFFAPAESLWVFWSFGPLYTAIGSYIWWSLSRFHWTMPTNLSDND